MDGSREMDGWISVLLYDMYELGNQHWNAGIISMVLREERLLHGWYAK